MSERTIADNHENNSRSETVIVSLIVHQEFLLHSSWKIKLKNNYFVNTRDCAVHGTLLAGLIIKIETSIS